MITLGLSQPTTRSNPLESPSVPLTSSIAWEILSGGGQSDAAEIVNSHTAMQLATVNACTQLISGSISSLPLILYEKSASGKQEASNDLLHYLLTHEPNPDSTAATMWNTFIGSVLLTGNGYLEITRNSAGVAGLWFMNPNQVKVVRLSNGSLVYQTTEAGQERSLPAKDVIHVPAFSTNGVMGVSVIHNARNVIGSAIAMDRFGSRFFANFAMPQLALLTKLKVRPEDKYKMRQDWEALQTGNNQHRVAVLDQEMDIKVLSVPPEDAQFLETKKLSRQEICGLFKVHPSQIGDTSRVAGETYAGQQITFLRDCLRPWMNAVQQELVRKLLPGQYRKYTIAYDTRDLLKVDQKTQMESLMTARQAGLLTTDEGREMAGLDPVGGEVGSLILAPVNMCDVRGLVGSKPPATAQPKKVADNDE